MAVRFLGHRNRRLLFACLFSLPLPEYYCASCLPLLESKGCEGSDCGGGGAGGGSARPGDLPRMSGPSSVSCLEGKQHTGRATRRPRREAVSAAGSGRIRRLARAVPMLDQHAGRGSANRAVATSTTRFLFCARPQSAPGPESGGGIGKRKDRQKNFFSHLRCFPQVGGGPHSRKMPQPPWPRPLDREPAHPAGGCGLKGCCVGGVCLCACVRVGGCACVRVWMVLARSPGKHRPGARRLESQGLGNMGWGEGVRRMERQGELWRGHGGCVAARWSFCSAAAAPHTIRGDRKGGQLANQQVPRQVRDTHCWQGQGRQEVQTDRRAAVPDIIDFFFFFFFLFFRLESCSRCRTLRTSDLFFGRRSGRSESRNKQ
jgi:hypothetical protein